MNIDFTAITIVCSTCVVLPILIVWLVMKGKANTTNKRTEIILAALEKNGDVDIEELLNKMAPKKSPLMNLLNRQLWGYICIIAGACCTALGIVILCLKPSGDDCMPLFVLGTPFLAAGIALLVNYHTGKKLLLSNPEEKATAEADE